MQGPPHGQGRHATDTPGWHAQIPVGGAAMAADSTSSAPEFIDLYISTCLVSCIKIPVISIYMSTNHDRFQTELVSSRMVV